MSGELDTASYEMVRARAEDDQLSLNAFSDEDEPTTIAVVRLPRDTGIDEYCDEWTPELGVPERHLSRFWAYREGYETNSAVANPVERAFHDADVERYYSEYVRSSDDAQAALNEIVSRLESGEDITLVCFEGESEPCHRRKLAEFIEARVDSDLELVAVGD